MKILFVHTGKSFLPELSAYSSHLFNNGHEVAVVHNENDISSFSNFDVVFRFGGFLRNIKKSSLPEIHEYHSASTTTFPRLKNLTKSLLAHKPEGRVFLNAFVKSQYCFLDSKPYIFRDMGADASFLDIRNSQSKQYDVVYAGSISGRVGLVDKLEVIASKGIKIGVAGSASQDIIERLTSCKMIDYVGCLDRKEMYEFLSLGRYGLNYCPDIYPLKYQTSTKVVEYLVAGLPIISNSYSWMENFSDKLGFSYLDIDCLDISNIEKVNDNQIVSKNIAKSLTWEAILERAKFLDYLQSFSY